MIKRLFQKYQAYRDKKFLARLERVLSTNIVKSDLLLSGGIYIQESVWMMLPKSAIEDILNGTPLSLVQERLRQEYYGKLTH